MNQRRETFKEHLKQKRCRIAEGSVTIVTPGSTQIDSSLIRVHMGIGDTHNQALVIWNSGSISIVDCPSQKLRKFIIDAYHAACAKVNG